MNIQSTKSVHFKNGRYTAEREQVHAEMIDKLLSGINPAADQPLAIYLGGGSASGKTTISQMLTESFKSEGESVVLVDSDHIKTLLPEYKTLIKSVPEQAASILHDESSDISEALYSKALESQINLIFDGTMKSAEKYERLIQNAQSFDYSTSIVIADVPLQEAFRRADVRYEIEKRRVPREIIELSHKSVPITFQKIKDKVDSFYLYDTTQRHPEQFYSMNNGKVKVHNEERLSQFYEKAGTPVLEKWITPSEEAKLLDILKKCKGLPIDETLTAGDYKRSVSQYSVKEGHSGETLQFYYKGSNTLQSLQLVKYP
ncbi:zeta toxin family protein [Paenibacillus alvei]|nr:zeta toxin family protein [Paenibacillus alvei]MCY9755221.1 zeta toxin family protein [Paenibacillus alvei]